MHRTPPPKNARRFSPNLDPESSYSHLSSRASPRKSHSPGGCTRRGDSHIGASICGSQTVAKPLTLISVEPVQLSTPSAEHFDREPSFQELQQLAPWRHARHHGARDRTQRLECDGVGHDCRGGRAAQATSVRFDSPSSVCRSPLPRESLPAATSAAPSALRSSPAPACRHRGTRGISRPTRARADWLQPVRRTRPGCRPVRFGHFS